MATNKEILVRAFQEKLPSDLLLIWQICSAISANDLINFWDQTILKWPFCGHFEFCNLYLTQEMQNDRPMNIKQNVMSHTRISHAKFHTEKSKMAASRPFIYFFFIFFYFIFLFFLLSRKSFMIADLYFVNLINFWEQTILK